MQLMQQRTAASLGRVFIRFKGTSLPSGSPCYKYYDLAVENFRFIDGQKQGKSSPKKKNSGSLGDFRKEVGRKKKFNVTETKSGRIVEGNYSLDSLTPEQRIAKVFGTRLTGADRESSSRVVRGEPKVIAGIKVPEKPQEPDNCCMSGCINCVWEMYNDDIKEWKLLRQQAAQRLVQRGGRWPENFHAPIRLLKQENLPHSLELKYYGTSSDADGIPVLLEEEDNWGEVPVSIQVFAQVEKRLKAKKKAKT